MARKSEIHDAAHKTVTSFGKIIGKRIYLRDSHSQLFADYLILVPFDDFDFYQRVELGIAHIVFGTDARARDAFVHHYCTAIEEQVQAVDPSPRNWDRFREGVRFIIGLLEEERVLSLWGKLYKGSEDLIRTYRAKETKHLVESSHHNILHYATTISTRHTIPKGDLSWFEPLMQEALERVRYGTFQSTLVVAKWIIVRLVDALLSLQVEEEGTQSFQNRVDALEKLADGMCPPSSQDGKMNTFVPSKHSALGADEKAKETAIEAINTEGQQVDDLLHNQQDAMAEILARVQEQVQSYSTNPSSEHTDLKARVVVLRISAEDVLKTRDFNFAEDGEVVSRMRVFFQRIMGKRRQFLDETGTVPDVEAMIRRRVLRRPEPVYRSSIPGRGFKAMLLLDRSASMSESKLYQCYRAQRLIRQALDFPFVDLHVWGFNGPDDGTVLITKFDSDVESMEVKKHLAPVKGATPLHAALYVARMEMLSGNDKKHIFILTDGAPMFWGWDGEPVPTVTIRKQVRTEVAKTRKSGIGVTTLVVKDNYRDLPDGLNARALDRMFGHGFWKLLDQDNFGIAVSDTVTGSFSKYLRHG